MVQRVDSDDIEQFTLVTNPPRTFTSSSVFGITGSVKLFARRSDIEKEVQPLSAFTDVAYDDHDIQQVLDAARRLSHSGSTTNINASISHYLAEVNAQRASLRKQQELEIVRFEPSFQFTKDTMRKNVVKNVLFPYYRSSYPSAHWAYTNYHCLNFFTASTVPSDTAILYPNSASAAHPSGAYSPLGPFTIEFYINPKYTTDRQGLQFKAGTLLHLSSSYAVSIVTGSSVDTTNRPDAFRIMLQLSHSADIPPTEIRPDNPNTKTLAGNTGSNARRDLIFLSEDNSLRKNHWHKCAIRWGTSLFNAGTGSFLIDGIERGTFNIPSSTIFPISQSSRNPDVLVVGNFYEGTNNGTSAQALFFNQNTGRREGLITLISASATTFLPSVFRFDHPLNAEVHDIRIYERYRSTDEVLSSSSGPIETGSMLFYLPPFFTKESPFRRTFGSDAHGHLQGGVLQTPFFAIDGTTEDPFNVAMSFGIGGHLLNLENFVRDFATDHYPRLLHLTSSMIGGTTQALAANEFLYATGSTRKMNVTVLPCDNGYFYPEFGILASGTVENLPTSGTVLDRFKNDLGHVDLSIINLDGMISTGSLFPGLVFSSGAFFTGIAGASPENPGVDPGEVLTIFQRTRDSSSNEVVFFDVSDMFYGNRIDPGTFVITDPSVTGTGGKVSITLKDDGIGGLYRADALTPHATWANVGNILYNEGIAVVLSPNVPLFGKDQFNVAFSGERNVHILRVHALARAGEVNSSSNPSFEPVSASLLAHENGDGFVYITGLNFHDDNLNVVMKSRYAQPVIKRNSDRIMFRTKVDF